MLKILNLLQIHFLYMHLGNKISQQNKTVTECNDPKDLLNA